MRIGGLLPTTLIGLALMISTAGAVDDAALRAETPDGTEWLTYGHGYDNQRFSALDQINTKTVGRLVPRWIYQTGISATFQTSPLVAGGVMYLTTPRNHVVALDAATGIEHWRYRHQMVIDKLCCGPANRGAAIAYGKIFTVTADGRLIALDQATGAVVWDVVLAAPDTKPTETLDHLADDDPFKDGFITGASGLGANMAPLVFDGLVIAGVTGAGYGLHVDNQGNQLPLGAVIGIEGKFGRRGYVSAFNAATGAEVWRWYTTPETGWEGEWRTTTPDGEPLHRDIAAEQEAFAVLKDAWKVGGGSMWTTPVVDPELGLIFMGTGNPAPQMDDVSRPGDNLYTVSLVALDAKTGQLAWYYQQVPHDLWGYDVGSPPVLFDAEHNGSTVPAVGQAGKTGWFYVHDRKNGSLLYKSAAFVPQENIFRPPTADGITIAPGAGGGASWSPVSYDVRTGLAYVAAMHMPMTYTVRERYADASGDGLRYTVLEPAPVPRWGVLSAIDTRAGGKIRWQTKTDDILVSGVLATAGNLVFMGEGNGYFNAYDSATGERIWQFQTGAGVNAPPITYKIGDTQYVAVAAGGHQLFGFPTGDAVIAFALFE